MAKQPFYHRAVILFTADRDISMGELERNLRYFLSTYTSVLPETIVVEECDSEAGDPADL